MMASKHCLSPSESLYVLCECLYILKGKIKNKIYRSENHDAAYNMPHIELVKDISRTRRHTSTIRYTSSNLVLKIYIEQLRTLCFMIHNLYMLKKYFHVIWEVSRKYLLDICTLSCTFIFKVIQVEFLHHVR